MDQKPHSMNKKDRKALAWVMSFVALAGFVSAMIVMRSWLGLFFGLSCLLLFLAPFAPGIRQMVEDNKKAQAVAKQETIKPIS
jgi:uncharacterized membrane protein